LVICHWEFVIFTARQLEDLHRSNGHVVLPYGARLTPLAVDWARGKKIQIGYGPDELVKLQGAGEITTAQATAAGAYLWWCDGPCGAGKAAVGAVAKEGAISGVDVAADAKNLVEAVKRVAEAVKERKAVGGVLLVQSAGAAVVLANRCAGLRAVVGTSLESLEAGIRAVAANVLAVEYPGKTFPQIKNLISRFVRGKRDVREDLQRQLREVASCG
jgi:hypothetical protein